MSRHLPSLARLCRGKIERKAHFVGLDAARIMLEVVERAMIAEERVAAWGPIVKSVSDVHEDPSEANVDALHTLMAALPVELWP